MTDRDVRESIRRFMIRKALLVPTLIAALAAGCGGDDGADDGADPNGAEPPAEQQATDDQEEPAKESDRPRGLRQVLRAVETLEEQGAAAGASGLPEPDLLPSRGRR